jgi:uncharacterized protein YegP (UPF0339 family)
MSGKFELKVSPSGKHMFNLKAGNGEVILTSELYESRAAAEKGIASVQKNAGDEARYERKESRSGEPYFVLKAANHQVIGTSAMYSSPAAMEKGIASVKANGPAAGIVDSTQ